MAPWPLISGVSTEMVRTYGNTIGSDPPVIQKYQHVPELTKNAPVEKFSHFPILDRDIESCEGVENNEYDEPDR